MKRRLPFVSAFALFLLTVLVIPPARALDEADRLWLVGERAFGDGLYPLARRALERLVSQHGGDARLPQALLLLGKARLTLGDAEPALEAFRRVQTLPSAPGHPLEGKFWEAEALFRLKRFAEARLAYDEALRGDAAAPHAPDALYGLAWSDLELRHPAQAVTAFREFLQAWPAHALAPSATFFQARALLDLKGYDEAFALLLAFPTKYPNHKLAADARYLLGWSRLTIGDPRGGLADLRAFVAAHPTHELAQAARRAITETLARHGDREELQEAYKALLEQTPPTAEGLFDAASIAARLQRAREREAALRKLRSEFPDHPLARRAAYELATVAFKQRQWKDAATLAHSAAQSDEETLRAEALLLAGESELKLKRFPAAATAFEAVGFVKSAEAGVRYRALAGLGLAREELREWRAALAAYESVAAKSPDATLRDWARERATIVKGRLKPAEKKASNRS